MRNLQPVSIAGIEFDALIESTEKYNATVPSYPVDSGFSVSDNVAIDALELSLTLYLTATPVTWLSRHGSGESRMNTICNRLLDAYTQREPVTVITRDKSYTNMVISSISIEKSQDNVIARSIPVTLKQVTVTSSAETEIPSKLGKSGTTQSNAGTAAATTTSGDSGGSEGSGGSGDVISDLKDCFSGGKTINAGLADAATYGIKALGSMVLGGS